jgi:hypothetical protein
LAPTIDFPVPNSNHRPICDFAGLPLSFNITSFHNQSEHKDMMSAAFDKNQDTPEYESKGYRQVPDEVRRKMQPWRRPTYRDLFTVINYMLCPAVDNYAKGTMAFVDIGAYFCWVSVKRCSCLFCREDPHYSAVQGRRSLNVYLAASEYTSECPQIRNRSVDARCMAVSMEQQKGGRRDWGGGGVVGGGWQWRQGLLGR